MNNHLLRGIPKTDEFLEELTASLETAELPPVLVLNALRARLAKLRKDILEGRVAELPGRTILADEILAAAKEAFSGLRPAINATGIILHTNLGRAPLPEAAIKSVTEAASAYSTLELDLDSGGRGSRQKHACQLLKLLTGAEAALVVNNNAAAVLLILSALCREREVIVSRGELVEIGGSFRIPDIMSQSGALLREVGCTNRTRINDYAAAIVFEKTGALMKVHPSNFIMKGFVEETSLKELATLAKTHGLPLIYDLGSGSLIDLTPAGLTHDSFVPHSLNQGADLVCFSGDKILGGPQAGIIVGRQKFIKPLSNHPLARVLRLDKLSLAALEATLKLYLKPEKARKELPVLAMIFESLDQLQSKAETLRNLLTALPHCRATVEPTEGEMGGGAGSEQLMPSWAVVLEVLTGSVQDLEKRLRNHEIPIIGRIHKNRLWLDVRTIMASQFEEISRALS